MGAKLMQYYEEAYRIGSFDARLRLAMLSLIPSAKAATVHDSPENIKKLEEAMAKVRKEFSK
jgi:hypothetical protein